jgi:hypothetical protein
LTKSQRNGQLYNPSGSTLAYPRDLNLNDMFFKYGIRINPDLVKDEQGSPIKLAIGEQGVQHNFKNLMEICTTGVSNSLHPIVKNLGNQI